MQLTRSTIAGTVAHRDVIRNDDQEPTYVVSLMQPDRTELTFRICDNLGFTAERSFARLHRGAVVRIPKPGIMKRVRANEIQVLRSGVDRIEDKIVAATAKRRACEALQSEAKRTVRSELRTLKIAIGGLVAVGVIGFIVGLTRAPGF